MRLERPRAGAIVHLHSTHSVAWSMLPDVDTLEKPPTGYSLSSSSAVAALLERREGNLTQSAREAEIDRVYLLRLLDKYDMRKK